MAHPIRNLIVAFSILLGGTNSAEAKQPLSIRFSVFAARPIKGLAYLAQNGRAVPLTFNTISRSERHGYAGDNPVRFTDLATGAVLAEASVPASIRDPLFLFLDLPEGKTRGLKYQVAVLDDSVAKLGHGQMAIVNLSGIRFSGVLGKTEFEVNQGLNAPRPLAQTSQLTLFADVRGKRRQAYSDTIRLPRSSRLLLILFPPVLAGAIEVQTRALVDAVPAAAK
jgi:hypothetical protein